MKPQNLMLALVLAAVAISVGGPAATADAPCPPTKAVFYTTDTQVLARTLAANPSDCADYYISISPVTAAPNVGEPRGGAALATVHAQGPQFHALAELRPAQWATYAAVNGWHATGVKLHDDMLAAGYDPAAGDTWAVNEVGRPSNSTVNTDVFNGVDGARANFQAFVQGLYTGSTGPALPGVVFAADPAQLAPDVAGYAHDLASFYADAPFWQDMLQYVAVWAQETYADARVWGVAGATLAQRTAYLEDYFLHGLRVAEEGNDATAPARAFLEHAYVPIASVSYSYGPPDVVTGIGFGYTAIGATGMQRFISAQTFALRSALGSRLGFAVVPKNDGTDRPAIYARVAAAVHDSQADPAGACSATGESCDFDVADAALTDSWKALANTQEGIGVAVEVGPGVSVTYDAVDARGATWFASSETVDGPSGWAAAGLTYDLATSAHTTGPVQVCLGNGVGHVFLHAASGWLDTTSAPGCGTAAALGAFALFVDPTPPVIESHRVGPLGADGWYTGDVAVSWVVSDAQTSITSRSGCDAVTLITDTLGATFVCTATSEGGTATTSVTVKRDATPPTLTCSPTPSSLWPPNGKLVPVTVAVAATDATSGAAGFLLTGAPASGAPDFDVGTPDVAGQLVAQRDGNGGDTTYTLIYTGRDVAGNVAQCRATISVPHDQDATKPE